MSTPFAGPPLDFDHEGARRLAAAFDDVADLLDHQAGRHPSLGRHATRNWEGLLRVEFDVRVDLTATDACRLADGLRQAATGVRELAAAAEAEDERRAWARDWEQQQADRAWYQRMADNVSDFFGGDEEIPRPPGPTTPPTTEVLVTVGTR